MERIYDAGKIQEALKLYPFGEIDLDVPLWILDTNNLAFEAEDGSVALFEFVRPGLYDGHYFFRCHGREAIKLAKQIIKLVYHDYGAKAIRGFTPVKHRAAVWMSRHLGFKDMGEVPTEVGPCIIFIMNLDEHFKNEGTDQ